MKSSCVLCLEVGGELLYLGPNYRVIAVNDKDYPGFLRIITNSHIKELTDLKLTEAKQIFVVLFQIESIMREILVPDKINIASFGNMVPHLHWHIIPRYKIDKHFPNPIWGQITNPNYIPDNNLLSKQQQLFTLLKSILPKFEKQGR